MKFFNLMLALPLLLVLGVTAHALLARAAKAVLWSWSPLARGEAESFTYERAVYHTAGAPMLQIVATAGAAGLLFWVALLRMQWWPLAAGLLLLAAAVALDLLRWERVAASANFLWFQRGLGGTVHQISIENIRDVAVDETNVRGLTLRYGMRSRLVRLRLRMVDKRVVALSKTDARGLDSVEAVANHLRHRRHQIDEDKARQRGRRPPLMEAAGEGGKDAELRKALRQLRKNVPMGAARSVARSSPAG